MFSFFSEYLPHFNIVKFSYQKHAFDYLRSLFKLEKNRANCQEIADYISELNQQSINHFITSEHWSFHNLMNETRLSCSNLFEARKESVGLLIDEVGFRKKGNMSACVARQYLGCIGKTDNGQVAVAAGLSQGRHYAPIDMRLFMPKAWEGDDIRRKKCAIPQEEKHISKPEMAKNMIQDALDNKIKFDFVNFDALYGNATHLLEYLDHKKVNFIGDIRSNFMLYFNKEKDEKCRVDQYVSNLLMDDFQEVVIRKSTKGILKARFHYVKVTVVTTEKKWLNLILLVRKEEDGKTKYSLSNMHDDHIKELAEKQSQRIYVEQLFKEGKNLVGMGDYQIRGWHGFHNHMAICMMAMLLITKVKIENEEEHYSSTTIRKIINLCIRMKIDDPNLAIDIIFKQHDRYIRQLKRDEYFEDEKT